MIRVFTRPCGKTYNEQHKAAYELLGVAAALCGYEVTEIKKTEKGKPYFENSNVFFSISHTDGYVAVAIGDSPCGVDIEGGREISKKIRTRFLNGCDEANDLEEWTKKESFGKLTGDGFFTDIKNDSIIFKHFKVSSLLITACAYKGEEISSVIETI